MSTSTEATDQTVVLAEYQRTIVRCSAATAARMHADAHVVVAPTNDPAAYEIRARHKVGVVRYEGLELRIVPKVAVSRLLYLASFRDDWSWHEHDTLLDTADDPLSALAHALVFHGERAVRPTPLQGYVTHERAEMRVRGRLLFDRQLSSRAGILLPAELRFDEYELGIIENRVLKAALLVVARFVAEPLLASRVRHLLAQLDGVEPWPPGMPVPRITFGRLNERYRSAIALARLVLERRSLEYPRQKTMGTSFLFNMNTVFESYLEAALRSELERRDGRLEGQYRVSLDLADDIQMKPDLTWWSGGSCLAVLDAKYKRTTNGDYPNADAYQMLAYCTRLGLDRGFLVYADLDGESTGSSVVRNAGVEIVVTAVDIGGTIAELQSSIVNLADLVEAGRSSVFASTGAQPGTR